MNIWLNLKTMNEIIVFDYYNYYNFTVNNILLVISITKIIYNLLQFKKKRLICWMNIIKKTFILSSKNKWLYLNYVVITDFIYYFYIFMIIFFFFNKEFHFLFHQLQHFFSFHFHSFFIKNPNSKNSNTSNYMLKLISWSVSICRIFEKSKKNQTKWKQNQIKTKVKKNKKEITHQNKQKEINNL